MGVVMVSSEKTKTDRSWPTRVSRKKRSPSMMFWCIGFEGSRLAAMVVRRRQSFGVVLSSLADANVVFGFVARSFDTFWASLLVFCV